MLTPTFNHLLCFNFIRCAKKVRKLINRPVVSLFGTRVSSTGTEMIVGVTPHQWGGVFGGFWIQFFDSI
jgi:hypothetical protein